MRTSLLCLDVTYPDDFGTMYAPMSYRGMDNYGGALFRVEQWPDWWQSRYYFFNGD